MAGSKIGDSISISGVCLTMLDPDARLLGLPGQVLIAGLQERPVPDALQQSGAEFLRVPAFEGRVDMQAVLEELARREFNEIQVEAGATLCGTLLQRGLADELLIYQAPAILGGTALSPFAYPRLDNMDDRVHLEWVDSRRIGRDLRLRLKPVQIGS